MYATFASHVQPASDTYTNLCQIINKLGRRVFLKDRKFCEDEKTKKKITRVKTQMRHICRDECNI